MNDRSPTIRVLFVCLGNICRSPMAQGVMQKLVNQHHVADNFVIESAGTSGEHDGENYHRETLKIAQSHLLPLIGKSRRVDYDDLICFDYILAMDSQNFADLRELDNNHSHREKILLLRQFGTDPSGDLDVPDPYYGGPEGFQTVHDIIEDACHGLLSYLTLRHGLRPYEPLRETD